VDGFVAPLLAMTGERNRVLGIARMRGTRGHDDRCDGRPAAAECDGPAIAPGRLAHPFVLGIICAECGIPEGSDMGRIPSSAAMLTGLMLLSSGAAGGDPGAGREVYIGQCISCHAMACDRQHGPALGDILGREAGSRPDFRYSDAMRELGLVWDEATLDAFLADPAALVPGTRMVDGPGVRAAVDDAEDRRNVMAYVLTGDTSLDLC
jgi:cytochrome c